MNSPATSESIEIPPLVVRSGSVGSSFPNAATIPDDILYEVVDGEIVEKIVGVYENEIANILVRALGTFATTHRLGRAFMEMMFYINAAKNLQRRPDVAFVSHARWPSHRRAPDVPVWDMVPDLAVEVVSPSNTADHLLEKIDEYFDAGVSRVWVVYPRRRVVYVYASRAKVQVLQLGQELDGGDLIPGFRLPLATLFEDDLES